MCVCLKCFEAILYSWWCTSLNRYCNCSVLPTRVFRLPRLSVSCDFTKEKLNIALTHSTLWLVYLNFTFIFSLKSFYPLLKHNIKWIILHFPSSFVFTVCNTFSPRSQIIISIFCFVNVYWMCESKTEKKKLRRYVHKNIHRDKMIQVSKKSPPKIVSYGYGYGYGY